VCPALRAIAQYESGREVCPLVHRFLEQLLPSTIEKMRAGMLFLMEAQSFDEAQVASVSLHPLDSILWVS
jgi:hypothetical protein